MSTNYDCPLLITRLGVSWCLADVVAAPTRRIFSSARKRGDTRGRVVIINRVSKSPNDRQTECQGSLIGSKKGILDSARIVPLVSFIFGVVA